MACTKYRTLTVLAALTISGCSHGNVASTSDYHAPAAPKVQHPLYDPYMPYGSANATWAAPIYDRAGTVTRPNDPGADRDRPNYESAPWATGAAALNAFVPPGTS